MTPAHVASRLHGLDRRLLPTTLRLRAVAIITLVLALTVGSTNLFFVLRGGEGTAVAIDDVLADFRSESAAAPVRDLGAVMPAAAPEVAGATEEPALGEAAPAAPVDTSAPVAEPTVAEPAATTQPDPSEQPAAPAAPAPAETVAPSPTAEPAPAAPTLTFPDTGVYTFDTTGGEAISTPGGARSYPEETYGIVRKAPGCGWTLELRLLEQHREETTFCLEGPRVGVTQYETDVEFYGAAEHQIFVCDNDNHGDLTQAPGDVTQGGCQGDEVTTSGTATYVRREMMTVGGVQVETMMYRFETKIEGRVQGTASQNVWVDTTRGFPVRIERKSTSRTSSFGAGVTYTEDATFAVRSLTPAG